MNSCEETRSRMTIYLDDELETSECSAIEVHLGSCEPCRGMFQAERSFLDSVRDLRRHRAASAELRTRVGKLLEGHHTGPVAPPELRQRVRHLLRQRSAKSPDLAGARRLLPNWVFAVSAIVAVALFATLWRLNSRDLNKHQPAASDFAEMAAATHQRHVLGQLPLEIISDVPAQISAWFSGKVPFLVKLPNYQESSGQEKLYRLEGARLVAYKSDYAAYVAYQMRSRPISLVVTSDAVAQASGGEQIVAKEITFHYNSINGLKVITWSDRGLTYALVSNLEERGQESCIVCHQGTKDRGFIESLKPR